MAKAKTDLSAALTGLVLGLVSLFLLITTIVVLTNHQYADETTAEASK